MKRYVHNIPAARALRQSETHSEALLSERLRDRRFTGLKFRRQHAIGAYVVDFYCHELRLALEIDGGVHLNYEQLGRDRIRQAVLEQAGLQIIRISTQRVEANPDAAIIWLGEQLDAVNARLPLSREVARGGRGVRAGGDG